MKKLEGRVAAAIEKAVLHDQMRVRVRPESMLTDWRKRIAPVGLHRFIARRSERGRQPRAGQESIA